MMLYVVQDEAELCSATAQFESFVLQFFDRFDTRYVYQFDAFTDLGFV